jgi:DNA-directed RNA polymerase specialized sigma24 family protein
MTEPDLAQRLADDLDGSFEALVIELQGPVNRFACRWCGNAQDAEEIAQDAFVKTRLPHPGRLVRS